MAYGDTLRTSTCNMNDVATKLEGLLVAYGSHNNTYGPVQSTSSTTDVQISTNSLAVTVAAGEVVRITAQVTVSHGTQYKHVYTNVYRDGVSIGLTPGVFTAPQASAGGNDGLITMVIYDAPAVGAHTYSIYWCVEAGGGTGYCYHLQLNAEVFQNS